ncbi:MAG: acetyl-CoA carboxylase, carboxyltransferase subunit beta [Puniceicoccales bacterium]|jgi:acetyl-CoA carboxylase carboxyl transferase subunit beta|nr:acetyl-CoA carboxylase, carboxyltransferase subunit beta [Puniceicoccales bacterium]
MALFGKPKYSTVATGRRKEIPADMFVRCPVSGKVVYRKDLDENWQVVPSSGYHFPLTAPDRIRLLVDADSFEETDTDLSGGNPLPFASDSICYEAKLEESRAKTGLDEAVIAGVARMDGMAISLAVMDFRFLGASMGTVVGERITRTIERGVECSMPVVIVCSSGGARMYEGILSLMQMAKTSVALAQLAEVSQPYIAILTNPTMAGVIASFASLGDLILAEPGALIGFAGPRVIRETIRQELPPGFQTAEFLLEHGLIDQIVPRSQLRGRIVRFLRLLSRSSSDGGGGKNIAEGGE